MSGTATARRPPAAVRSTSEARGRRSGAPIGARRASAIFRARSRAPRISVASSRRWSIHSRACRPPIARAAPLPSCTPPTPRPASASASASASSRARPRSRARRRAPTPRRALRPPAAPRPSSSPPRGEGPQRAPRREGQEGAEARGRQDARRRGGEGGALKESKAAKRAAKEAKADAPKRDPTLKYSKRGKVSSQPGR